MGPKVSITTVRIAPVGNVLHNSARAPFPPASLAAMMPEPTTAASRKAVPNISVKARCARDGISLVRPPSERDSYDYGSAQRTAATTAHLGITDHQTPIPSG
jgi:hypothetical protein